MAQGRAFEFQAQEQRDVSKLNRLYGQQQQAQGAAAAARQSETSAIMGGINALGGAIGSGAFGGLGGGGNNPVDNMSESAVLNRITQDPGGVGVEDMSAEDLGLVLDENGDMIT
jgi:hypothetical protein